MERCIARDAVELPALFERQQPSLRRSLHSIRARGRGGGMREVQAAAATRDGYWRRGVAVHNGFAVVVEGCEAAVGGHVHAGELWGEERRAAGLRGTRRGKKAGIG
jgi:hypothetical protein